MRLRSGTRIDASGEAEQGHAAGSPGGPVSASDDDFESLPDDDLSIDGSVNIDHAHVTSSGIDPDGIDEGLEDVDDYEEGGYHPIHLGDRLDKARYRVVHKLGHGEFSTVWLCRDEVEEAWVAVKILTADVEPDHVRELSFQELDLTQPGAGYIAVPLHSFVFRGPNGDHQCLVLPVLGPPVGPDLWHRLDDPGPVLRGMCRQACEALSFLHQNSICHGDFIPSNILVRLTNLNRLNEKQLLSALGEPIKNRIAMQSGAGLPRSIPRYLVSPADLSRLPNEYLTDQICVISFIESYEPWCPPKELVTPDRYLAPELLLGHPNFGIGETAEIWTLGCTLFEIRAQIPLSYMTSDDLGKKDLLLADIERFFGKPPDSWWASWDEGRADFLADDEGRDIQLSGDSPLREGFTLEKALRGEAEAGETDEEVKKRTVDIPEAERAVFLDLLCRVFQYEPSERPTPANVLQHDWFRI